MSILSGDNPFYLAKTLKEAKMEKTAIPLKSNVVKGDLGKAIDAWDKFYQARGDLGERFIALNDETNTAEIEEYYFKRNTLVIEYDDDSNFAFLPLSSSLDQYPFIEAINEDLSYGRADQWAKTFKKENGVDPLDFESWTDLYYNTGADHKYDDLLDPFIIGQAIIDKRFYKALASGKVKRHQIK